MIRFKIRTAMIGAMALVALSAFTLKSHGAGRGSAQARVRRRADPVGSAGAAQTAPERPGSRAAAVHHRQAGAHRVRLAEHDARAALAPHRRALRRRRYRARRRGQRPHAPGGQRRPACCPTRPRSTATPSSSRWPAAGRRSGEARRGPHATPAGAGAGRARDQAPSISAAAPTAPAASSCSSPIRARRSTCARKAIRSWSTSPAR